MACTKLEQNLDVLLEGRLFCGVDALEYIKNDLKLDELENFTKQELIALVTKAIVLISIEIKESNDLLDEKTELLNKKTELLAMLLKHYEIYPDLIEAGKSDAHFELVKTKAEIIKLKVLMLHKLAKKLPEIKLKAKISIPKSGGDNRWKKDIKTEEKAFVKDCWDNWQNEPSQYKNKTKFAQAMLTKFEQDDPKEQEKHLNSVAVITGWCTVWEKEK